MPTVHFINLTNGLVCQHRVRDPHYMRLRSSWCTQRFWWDIIRTLGHDFLMHAAMGYDVVVHDVSERKPKPRAVYKGLVWVRFVLNNAWVSSMMAGSRAGMRLDVRGRDATRYFTYWYKRRAQRDREMLWYYRPYVRLDPKVGVKLWYCGDIVNAHEEDRFEAVGGTVGVHRHGIQPGDDAAFLGGGDD